MLRTTVSKSCSRSVGRTASRTFSTAAFPFRPGYGLGSWMPLAVIEGMKTEAKSRSMIAMLDQMDADLTSTMRELMLQRDQLKPDFANKDTPTETIEANGRLINAMLQKMQAERDTVLQKKIASYEELFEVQQGLMASDVGFTTFAASAYSPVDWTRSKVDFVDRAADSITVHADFLNRTEAGQDADSHAGSVAASATAGADMGMFGSFKTTVASAVHSTVTRTQEKHDVESTLLVSAWATHSKVQQFNPCVLDADALMDGWNFYYPDDQIDLARLSLEDQGNELYLINEMFLGSTLIGMVHFVRSSETDTAQSADSRQDVAMAEVNSGVWLSGLTGSTKLSHSVANKAAQSLSQSGVQVKFDLLCLGYLPSIKSNTLENSVKVFKDFDPATFGVTGDTALVEQLDGQQNALAQAAKEQAQRQDNMGAVIKATMMGLAESDQQTYQVLDFKTFMDAFDDYTKSAPEKEGVGAPIGMNLRPYNKMAVINALSEKYYKKNVYGMPEPDAGGAGGSE